jgi:hypothetical protein
MPQSAYVVPYVHNRLPEQPVPLCLTNSLPPPPPASALYSEQTKTGGLYQGRGAVCLYVCWLLYSRTETVERAYLIN